MRTLLSALLLLPTTCFGNDTLGIIQTSGVVIEKSDQIAMLDEDLIISPKVIHVKYKFKNTGVDDITSAVIFPLPALSWEIPYSFPLDKKLGDNWVAIDNPMHFELSVDGRKIPIQTTVKKNEENHTYELNYHWKQTFPAGREIIIEHTYLVAAGTGITSDDEKKYCEDEGFKKSSQNIENNIKEAILKKLKPVTPSTEDLKRYVSNTMHYISFNRVAYILKTGANWKGPIGHFKITLQKEDALDLISTCFSGLKKTSNKTFVYEANSFVPQNNIDILFENHYDNKMNLQTQ